MHHVSLQTILTLQHAMPIPDNVDTGHDVYGDLARPGEIAETARFELVSSFMDSSGKMWLNSEAIDLSIIESVWMMSESVDHALRRVRMRNHTHQLSTTQD